MSKNQYTVSLTTGQRRSLRRLIQNDDAPAFKVRNARILLKGDRGNASDKAIARKFNISVGSVERIQKRFTVEGLDTAIETRVNVKDVKVVVNAADQETLVDFGSGQLNVADGKTSVTYPGGSIKVGNGVFVTDAAFEVSTLPTGDTTIVFPGGGVSYTSGDGQVVVRYPDGNVFYSSADGLEVKYVGGQVTVNSAIDVQFTGGGVQVAQGGATSVQFTGGSVEVGKDGATVVQFPGGSFSYGSGGINISF
jgi:Homeodomain-like domain